MKFIIISNTEGTSGINACGVEGSGSEHVLNETIDIEARKIQGQFLEAHLLMGEWFNLPSIPYIFVVFLEPLNI